MRIVNTLEVTKTIRLPSWNDDTREISVDFWRGRGFVFSETRNPDDVLRGIRGSLWGNLLSFDMSKLKATLTMVWSARAQLECVMQIDGRYQDLTEWNEAYWKLEMETLESYLLHGDMRDQEWTTFLRGDQAAAVRWCLSASFFGRTLPRSRRTIK